MAFIGPYLGGGIDDAGIAGFAARNANSWFFTILRKTRIVHFSLCQFYIFSSLLISVPYSFPHSGVLQ